MPERGWKKAERMIAKDCGGKRIPVTGERQGADVGHEVFSFQLKVRKALPDWLFGYLGGICRRAKENGTIGVLILNRPRRPRKDALVIVRWGDWCDLVGTPPPAAMPENALEEASENALEELFDSEKPEGGGE
jgi:hypothetical protein